MRELKPQKNWGMGHGIASYEVNAERITFLDMVNRFPELNLIGKDFSSWGFDKRIATDEGGQGALLPSYVRLEFGFPLNKDSLFWLRNTELRIAISFGASDSYSGNIEKISGNNTIGGIIDRELYYLGGSSLVGAFHGSIIRYTPNLGRKKRLRFGIGFEPTIAAIYSDYSLYHVQGTYIVTEKTSNPHYWNYYPAEDLTHQWQNIGNTSEQLMSIGYDVPLHVNFRLGKHLIIGYQLCVGQYFTVSGTKPSLTYNIVSNSFSLGYRL